MQVNLKAIFCRRIFIVFCLLSLIFSSVINAQDSIRPINERLKLDVPLFDVPFAQYAAEMAYNKRLGELSGFGANPSAKDWLRGYESLSMSQALAITKDLHATNYYFNNKLWNRWIKPENRKKFLLNRLAANASAGVLDYLLAYNLMVFGPVWMHEEFHRNGLTLQGISSFDDTYYRFGGEGWAGGSVSKIMDADMVRFKQDAPQELVRTFEAGVEGQYAFVRELQKDNFFHQTDYPNVVMNILITNQAVNYVRQFQQPDYDDSIDSMNFYGKKLSERDFVGWDFTAWVYDLHRPDEPYNARGPHPYGEGINRVIKRGQLTQEEDDYLVKMGKLQYLNFMSPSMVGVHSIRLGSQTRFNFAVRHILTSFGYDLGGDIFLNRKGKNWLLGVHTYHNHEKIFGGIELERQGISSRIGNKTIEIDARAMLWMQPEKESFYAEKGKPGGLLRLRANMPFGKTLKLYAEAEGKTNGWVSANPYIHENLSFRMGLLLDIQRQ